VTSSFEPLARVACADICKELVWPTPHGFGATETADTEPSGVCPFDEHAASVTIMQGAMNERKAGNLISLSFTLRTGAHRKRRASLGRKC
jgi:hypothetical protein